MQRTENYNLKQPDVTDPVHVSDLNSNMAILDSAVHDAQTTGDAAKGVADALIAAANGEQPTLEQLNKMSTLFSDPVYDTLYALGYTTSFSEDSATWELNHNLELTGYNVSANVVNADIFHTGTEDTGYLTVHEDITKGSGNWGNGENSSLDATLADIYSKIGGGGGDNAKADAMYDALDVQATSEAYPAADKLIPLYDLFEDNRMTVGDRIISTSGYPYGEDGRVGLELNECNIKLNDGVINLDDGVIRFGDNSTELNRSQLKLCPYTYEDEEGHELETSKVELDGYFGDIHLDRGISVGKLDTEYIMEITDSDVTFNPGWPGGNISLRDTLSDIYSKIEGGGGGSAYITIEDNDITNSYAEDWDIYTGWLAYFDAEHSVIGDPHSLSSILNSFYEIVGHTTDLSFLGDDIQNISGWNNDGMVSLKSVIADLYSKIAALSN